MINIFQLLSGLKNPQQLLQQLSSNNQVIDNPIAKNALNMAQNGNMKGVEDMARNLCKEKGINADEFMEQIRKQFNL